MRLKIDKKLIILLVLLLTTMGCSSLVDLSKREIEKYNLDRTDMNYIQYYLRGSITLRKEDYSKTVDIPSHKVKGREERKIEDIIINYRTPCIPVYVSNNLDTVEVDFGENLYFKFTNEKSGVFQPISEHREGSLYNYRGEEYTIKYERGIPVLQFRKSDVTDHEHNRKYIKGKRFN